MMNRDLNSALRDALILIAITLISGLALGGVYALTKEPIEYQKQLAVTESCYAVFPVEEGFVSAASFEPTALTPSEALAGEFLKNGVKIGNIYQALSAEGQVIGYAIEVTSAEGYGGDIRLMCGITTEGVLRGVSILEISETAGLGMRAGTVLVPQIHNMDVQHITFTKTGKTLPDEIDAISGATVTTTAFVNCLNAVLDTSAELSPVEGGAA